MAEGLKRTTKIAVLSILFVIISAAAFLYLVPMPPSSEEVTEKVRDTNVTGIIDDTRQAANHLEKTTENHVDTVISETGNSSESYIIPVDGTSGSVTRVVDGDTLDIDDTRIRLALVNTPERGDLGYAEATTFTRETCPKGTAAVYDTDDLQKQDRYGRTVAKVWCFGHSAEPPTVSLNELLLEHGHAHILSKYCHTSEFRDDSWAEQTC